mgnify:CR=1 FL=1|jgi:hypothetical protein
MRFFSQKPTVGSRLHEPPEQVVSEEQRLLAQLESHNVMRKGKVGRLFSPLTGSRTRDLSHKSNQIDEIL